MFDIEDIEKKVYQVNSISQILFSKNHSYIYNIKQREEYTDTISKMLSNAVNLEIICNIKDGIILGTIKDLFLSDEAQDNRYKKWLEGNEVSRYSIDWTGRYICYEPNLIKEELKRKIITAKKKATTASDLKKFSRSGIWLRDPKIFNNEKILTRQNAKRIIGVLDCERYYVKNSLHSIILKDKSYNLKFILGVINSKLIDFYFQNQIGKTGEIFSQMKIEYIRKLPICKIDFENNLQKKNYEKLISHVNTILELQKNYARSNLPQEQTALQRQIDATDKQIDKLVYQLYGLTKEEIKIVEESNGS